MARNFATGNAYLTIAASTVFDINTDVSMFAVVRPTTLGTDNIVCVWGVAGANGYGISMKDTDKLNFIKVSQADVTAATLAFIDDTWQAVYAFSTHQGDAHFKRLRLDTNVLETETVTNSNSLDAPSNDPGIIGNWLIPASTLVFEGDIDRVFLWQGSQLSDDAFRLLAHGFLPTFGLLHGCYLFGDSPEGDSSGNGNNPTVTLTSVVDSAPLGPPFAYGLGWKGAFTAAVVASTFTPRVMVY